MNRSTSKAGSSSCWCVNDIEWKAKGQKEQCEYNEKKLRIMLANSLAVIGLSWSVDEKKCGTEPTLTNQMDPGIEWQKK